MKNTNVVTVVNPACEELTSKIKGSMYNVAKEFVYIGFLLAECEYYEHYKEWGYSSIHEYASEQLGFKKSSTYNFINVCKVFCNPSEALPFSYFMKEPYSRFNYSQLVEMLSMNDKQRSQVSSDMTVKQIREVKKSSDEEPNWAKFYNLQFHFIEFKSNYTRRINGKIFEFTISGKKVEKSYIWPEGYYISFDTSYDSSGQSSPHSRIVDYEKFKEIALSSWHCYDKTDDSRRLEEAPAPVAPEEPIIEPDIVSYPGYDLLIPLKDDLRPIFKSVQEAYLKLDHNSSTDLFEMVFGYLKSNDYVICKKVNKKPGNRFALKR